MSEYEQSIVKPKHVLIGTNVNAEQTWITDILFILESEEHSGTFMLSQIKYVKLVKQENL